MPKSYVMFVCAFLACCATYKPSEADLAASRLLPAPESQETAESLAERSIKQRLIDPTSPIFDHYLVVNSIYKPPLGAPVAGWFMCGTVNSKNRFGGYVGRATYLVRFSESDPDNSISSVLIDGRDKTAAAVGCRQIYDSEYLYPLANHDLAEEVEKIISKNE